jgi:hypothetical protein
MVALMALSLVEDVPGKATPRGMSSTEESTTEATMTLASLAVSRVEEVPGKATPTGMSSTEESTSEATMMVALMGVSMVEDVPGKVASLRVSSSPSAMVVRVSGGGTTPPSPERSPDTATDPATLGLTKKCRKYIRQCAIIGSRTRGERTDWVCQAKVVSGESELKKLCQRRDICHWCM